MIENFEFKDSAEYIPDERNIYHSDLSGFQTKALPVIYSIPYAPEDILMQYKVGICTAIQYIQQANYYQKYISKTNMVFDFNFQYLCQKKYYDGNWIEGSSPAATVYVAKNIGMCPKDKFIAITGMTLDPNDTYATYLVKLQKIANDDAVMKQLLAIASQYRIYGYAFAKDPNDPDEIAQMLNDSKTGLICITNVYKTWWNDENGNSTWESSKICELRNDGKSVGGHQYGINGYDYTTHHKLYHPNTWSKDWSSIPNEDSKLTGGIASSTLETYHRYQVVIVYWIKEDAPVAPITQFIFTKDLSYKMANDDVKQLQIRLGLPVKYQTGYYGDITRQAVRDYQIKHGIAKAGDEGFGRCGSKTRASLNNSTN